MDESLENQLQFLGLPLLQQHWQTTMREAMNKKPSYQRFLTQIIEDEYEHKSEKRRLNRIKAAKIPQQLVMGTFPFNRQPRLKKKMVLQLYDSLEYMKNNQVLLLIGPTGCGKTGLASAYLIHAINQGYSGRFIDFQQLLDLIYQGGADHSERKRIKRFASVNCLLIDEIGYMPIEEQKAGLFFELMKKRHKTGCTIITTQSGFEEWEHFITNAHLRAAIIDRITENCTVFNMTQCISIRPKHVKYATESLEKPAK